MKNSLPFPFPKFSTFRAGLGALVVALSVWFCGQTTSYAVPITGANGTTVDFAGVKAATPAGLQVKILADGNVATVPWDKFDMAKMETEQPDLFTAYQKTQSGETVDLYLGVFAGEKPKPKMDETPAIPKSQQGFKEVTLNGKSGSGFKTMTVAMRDPSPNAKAIFVGAFGGGPGEEMFSSIYLARGDGTSWDNFLAINKLVPVGVRVNTGMPDPRKEPFFLADKGSGDALLQAIETLAKQSGRDDLAEAPIVIYGREVMGSALAYNLAQYKPERVVCAVAMNGPSFFTVEPTEASVKVPVLIVKGEYDDAYREWELEPTLDENSKRIDPPFEGYNRYVSTLPMRPNWTRVIQPRGTGDINAVTEALGKAFVDAVIKQRFGGGTYADMVPDIAYMGNLEDKTVKNMPDDVGVLKPNETWLPDQVFASVWRQFLEGTLSPPPPVP